MNMRKVVAGLVAGISSSAVLAEGNTLTVDTTQAEAAVGAVGTALSSLISGTITQNVLLILGAGLVIAAIMLGIRWMMRGGKAAAR